MTVPIPPGRTPDGPPGAPGTSSTDAAGAPHPAGPELRGPVVPVEATADLLARLDLPHADDVHPGPLHAANTRGRAAAIATLEAAFPGLGLGRATQATDATTLTVGRAHPSVVAALDGQGLLDDALRSLTFRPGPQLRMVRDKEQRDLGDIAAIYPDAFPGGRHRASAGALAAALDDGYTAVLDGIDLRTAAGVRLAALFERAFGCPVNINGYLSTRHHTSFGAHWDDQEVVILQLVGPKDWAIEAPAALSMNKAVHGEAVSGRAMWQGRLGPGDAVYVPRGWGHLVSGIDELTFHYTITIPRLNGLHVLEGVLGELTGQRRPEAGRPLPITPTDAGDALAPGELLGGDPAALDGAARRAVARQRYSFPRRPVGTLHGQVAALLAPDLSGVAVACPDPGGWVVLGPSPDPSRPAIEPTVDQVGDQVGDQPGDQAADQDGAGSLVAGLGNRLLRIPHAHLDAVGALTDGLVHDAGGADPDLVRSLMRLGVLEVVAEPTAWGLALASSEG